MTGCRLSLCLLAGLAAGAACSADPDPELGATSAAIVGGHEDPADDAVVMLVTAGAQCTGTLIAPRVVLTAAHCIKDAIDAGINTATVYFGAGVGSFFDTRQVIDLYAHRYYSAGLFEGYDIGLMRLASDAPQGVVPIPFHTDPLTDEHIDTPVRVVGYGATSGDGSGSGTKRQAEVFIRGVTDEHIVIGEPGVSTCFGDSGGPTFMQVDGVEKVIAVSAFVTNACNATANNTRVDIYIDTDLKPVLDAWTGPCPHDGTCDSACEVPDPDCDICLFDGICGTGCPAKDLDCPVGGFGGDLCSSDEGCESLRCEPAPDDPRVSYCTNSCDPNDATSCEAPIGSCEQRGDEHLCGFSGPTPSTQGAACLVGGDCRSGVCDPDDRICVEQCGDGLPACADGFECRDLGGARACRLPSGDDGWLCDGGAGSGRDAGTVLLLLALALGLRRARWLR